MTASRFAVKFGEADLELDDAISAIGRGRALLFVGAGYSLEALNELAEFIPAGTALSRRLMAAIGSSDDADYSLAAELFLAERGEDALLAFLSEHLTAYEVSDSQVCIANAPWRRLYTTNFDNVLELCCTMNGRPVDVLTPSQPPSPPQSGAAQIVHLHGRLERTGNEGGDVDLVRSRLVDPELMRTKWPNQIQVDIESSEAVFIVGYSLADFHIARLLRATTSSTRKTFIVVEHGANKALIAYLARFGKVIDIGLSGLGDLIAAAQNDWTAATVAPPLTCFDQYLLPSAGSDPTTDSTIGLLVSGILDQPSLLGASLSGIPYGISRSNLLRHVDANRALPLTLVLQSRIGNGKSTALQRLAFEMVRSGIHVYTAKYPLDEAFEELDLIRQERGRRAFLFDRTQGFEKIIFDVSQNLSAGDVLVVSTRLTEIATEHSPIRRMLPSPYTRVDLNALSDNDVIELEAWLTYFGIWGSQAGNSQPARVRFIRERCGREIRSVVLALFQNSSISARINHGVTSIVEGGELIAISFACLLISRFANCPLNFFDVCELVGADPYQTRSDLERLGGAEFVQIGAEDFDIRSPVLAEFILANGIESHIVFRGMTTMVDALVSLQDADWRYEEALPNLMRFTVIGRIFAGSEKREMVIPLYENLLRYRIVRENPHFWLQFAMARMERLEWDLADKCLQNGYAEARRRGSTYRTYMLDNQRAKFLLRSRMPGAAYTDQIDAMREALDLFKKQVALMKAGLDVHVLSILDPLLGFRAEYRSIIPEPLSRRFSEILRDLERAVRESGSGLDSATGEEQRLVDLLRQTIKST